MTIISFSSLSICSVILASSILYFYKKKIEKSFLYKNHFISFIFEVIKNPALTFSISYLIYAALFITAQLFLSSIVAEKFIYANYVINTLNFAILYWVVLNLISNGRKYLLQLTLNSKNFAFAAILPAITNSIYAIFILFMLNLFITGLGLTGTPAYILTKIIKLSFIATLGWIFIQVINAIENYLFTQYSLNENVLHSRKLKTQIMILKRIILFFGIFVTTATMLMVFDSVKNLGAGLLTTAGIISAVSAFASQQSLSRLFAGLQLAFTQPIKIGDTVIIDNEFGEVEEINLSYVVIKLWDLRRLIKPTDFFTTNGVQNLTRESTQLLGTIFLYTDYTLPVEKVRSKFFEILEGSTLWNKKVKSLEVTDITERSMQIRALMSADNASLLWKLRCETREQLMQFLVNTYPECLSKSRTISTNLATDKISS